MMYEAFLDNEMIRLDATLGELAAWQNTGLAVYATPAPADPTRAVHAYVARRPRWRNDWCLATPYAFLDAEGRGLLDAITEANANEVCTCCVPRMRRAESPHAGHNR